MSKQSNESPFLTRRQTSTFLHVSLSTIHNFCKQGLLTRYQIGGKILFLKTDVEKAVIKLKK